MTIECHRVFFLLKCQVKPIWPGLCVHTALSCPRRRHARDSTGGVCSRSPCVYNTDSHPWGTLQMLPYPKSISLLPENLILYKNMTVSLENNIVFFNKTW